MMMGEHNITCCLLSYQSTCVALVLFPASYTCAVILKVHSKRCPEVAMVGGGGADNKSSVDQGSVLVIYTPSQK